MTKSLQEFLNSASRGFTFFRLASQAQILLILSQIKPVHENVTSRRRYTNYIYKLISNLIARQSVA